MERFRSDVRKNLFRMSISITQDMESWLQGLSNTMKATGGYKLPKSYLIRGVLNAVMELDINIKGIKNEKQFKSKIIRAFCKYK